MIRISCVEGCTPAESRRADVVPFLKKGDRDLTRNFRPVSLTSGVYQLLEKITMKLTVDFLVSRNYLREK